MKHLRVYFIMILLIVTTSLGFAEVQEVTEEFIEFPTLEQELAIDYSRLTPVQVDALQVLYSKLEAFEWTDAEGEEDTYLKLRDDFYDLLRTYNIEGPVESYEDYLNVLKPRFKATDVTRIYTLVDKFEAANTAYNETVIDGTEAEIATKSDALDTVYSEVYYLFEENQFDFDEFDGHVIAGNMNYGLFDILDGQITLSELSITKAKDISAERMALYQKAWTTTKSLMTDSYLKWFTELELNTDGYEEDMAFVRPIDDERTTWRIGLDLRDAFLSDGTYHDEFYLTLVHELFHTMSLNAEQFMVEAPSVATTYVDSEYGHTTVDSYVNMFYQDFWKSIMAEYETYESGEAYYADHMDDFVTEYASTVVTEDIAESFSYFVVNEKPLGETLAEKKILFFYQFPELVEYRTMARTVISAE